MKDRDIVFVVDDDVATLRGLKRLLRQFGFPSMLFATAEAFEDHGDIEGCLCVLLDINLNDNRSGIDLSLGLKAAGCAVPIIYMTGNDHPTVRHAALESSCLAYLTKPFAASSLIEPLERARMTERPHAQPSPAPFRASIAPAGRNQSGSAGADRRQ